MSSLLPKIIHHKKETTQMDMVREYLDSKGIDLKDVLSDEDWNPKTERVYCNWSRDCCGQKYDSEFVLLYPTPLVSAFCIACLTHLKEDIEASIDTYFFRIKEKDDNESLQYSVSK